LVGMERGQHVHHVGALTGRTIKKVKVN